MPVSQHYDVLALGRWAMLFLYDSAGDRVNPRSRAQAAVKAAMCQQALSEPADTIAEG